VDLEVGESRGLICSILFPRGKGRDVGWGISEITQTTYRDGGVLLVQPNMYTQVCTFMYWRKSVP
jgi:hypothetical protein